MAWARGFCCNEGTAAAPPLTPKAGTINRATMRVCGPSTSRTMPQFHNSLFLLRRSHRFFSSSQALMRRRRLWRMQTRMGCRHLWWPRHVISAWPRVAPIPGGDSTGESGKCLRSKSLGRCLRPQLAAGGLRKDSKQAVVPCYVHATLGALLCRHTLPFW